ncbi:hypothetical protein FAES_3266 [Fibrella aestuarina BUZ 2]|uniref:Uncharacterized protein n=1 Tax=Fibrella aestuarina BUZ 2 TaxID=1166018 RepID=I0KAX2_9BACT|nr:hypothetical protein [Fibrella aestuarina]CCH01275.1 hypothetical protein FAES_3266 [Fibrella aestuarina BUZ 2]
MFYLNSKVKPLSGDDQALYENAVANVDSIARHTYTKRESSAISAIYHKYVDRVKPALYASYVKNQRYLDNKRPTGAQAMHALLTAYLYFVNQGNCTDEDMSTLLWSEWESVEERRELLRAMYEYQPTIHPLDLSQTLTTCEPV